MFQHVQAVKHISCDVEGCTYKCAANNALVFHKQREHGIHNMQRQYIVKPWCPICLSMLFTISKCRIHLRDSKTCRRLALLNLTPMVSAEIVEVDRDVDTTRKELAKQFQIETKAVQKQCRLPGPLIKIWEPPLMYQPTQATDWEALKQHPSWKCTMKLPYEITYEGVL